MMKKIDTSAEDLVLSLVESGVFKIDEDGRIWRMRQTSRTDFFPCWNIRRAEYKSTNGYLRIRIMVGGVRVRASAHRVVHRFFHGDIPDGYVVNHINRKRKDNRPSNLEAITQSQNVRHALGQPYTDAYPGT